MTTVYRKGDGVILKGLQNGLEGYNGKRARVQKLWRGDGQIIYEVETKDGTILTGLLDNNMIIA